ncbi:MAG: 2-C-methyl-D-erythritol 4-phosphate cytidylyltransferase, partial [Clostridia bacterium]|nr:2-C-methyl-D-erythritol 4-phosphate cytidylyltransferase [Clostridia bacterium]
MNYAAIMAGGSGSRMGVTDVPKQFIALDGLPIIIRTLKVFADCEQIEKT